MASESKWFVKEWQAVRLLQRELIIEMFIEIAISWVFPLFKHSKHIKKCWSMYVYIYIYTIIIISIKSLLYVVC